MKKYTLLITILIGLALSYLVIAYFSRDFYRVTFSADDPRVKNDPDTVFIENIQKDSHLMRKFAEDGNITAMFFLGDALINGRGVDKNVKEGINWMSKVAEQNGDYSGRAKEILGIVYLSDNLIKDESKAFYWTKQAAEEGYPDSQLKLSTMYSNGVGTAPNPELASQWKQKAEESFKNPKVLN